jgi:hypothetical protein
MLKHHSHRQNRHPSILPLSFLSIKSRTPFLTHNHINDDVLYTCHPLHLVRNHLRRQHLCRRRIQSHWNHRLQQPDDVRRRLSLRRRKNRHSPPRRRPQHVRLSSSRIHHLRQDRDSGQDGPWPCRSSRLPDRTEHRQCRVRGRDMAVQPV